MVLTSNQAKINPTKDINYHHSLARRGFNETYFKMFPTSLYSKEKYYIASKDFIITFEVISY